MFKVVSGKTEKLVPKPSDRENLIRSMHSNCGHFGVKRTLHLVMLSHWWKGMLRDVSAVVSRCQECARIKASFNMKSTELQPLEIKGMFYRWGVDLFGPMPVDEDGFKYVMIMIEYFTKHVEAVPLKDKRSETTARAFLEHVISRFGACAEVVTDGGTEFQMRFQELLEQCFIDHRITSPNHPQADGLAERAVQTFKSAIRKLCVASKTKANWSQLIPWISLGYRCSKQASTGFSPYELMYATEPCLPPAIKQTMVEPISFDDPDLAANSFLTRSLAVSKACPVAWNNLRIAQHRDTLQYNTKRGGGWNPKLRKFNVGDFVYVRTGGGSKKSWEPMAKQLILRVVEIRPSGVLQLQGKCGSLTTNHISNCAPCHLPNIDPTIDHTLARPDAAFACHICNWPDEQDMLLCDSCGLGYHTYCLKPPLATVHKGAWQCPTCIEAGVPLPRVEPAEPAPQRPVMDENNLEDEPWADLSAEQRIKLAASFDGRVVAWEIKDKGDTEVLLGKVEFLGTSAPRGRWFDILLEDGRRVPDVTVTKVRRSLMSKDTPFTDPPKIIEHTPKRAARAGKRVVSLTTHTSIHPFHTSPILTLPPRDLPYHWSSYLPNVMHMALSMLMPGHWSMEHATMLSNFTPGSVEFTHHTPHTGPDIIPAIFNLMSQLDFSSALGILDPFAGAHGVSEALQVMGITAHSNDIDPNMRADFTFDALQPGTFDLLNRVHKICTDVIVTKPWVTLLDLAIPLMYHFTTSAVCVLVPASYLIDAPYPRRSWLDKINQRGLLMTMDAPVDSHLPHTWLVLFNNNLAKEQLHNGLSRS